MSVPRLHQSIAHVLISRSPLHAWAIHPDLGGQSTKGSAAKTTGSLVDAMLLGSGPDVVVIDPVDYPNKKGGIPDGWTNDAIREARDSAIAAGKLPILKGEHSELISTVETLRARLAEKGIEFSGASQVPVEWTSPNAGVACAGRLDHLLDDLTIYDLKTTRNASEEAIQRSMISYGYDIQRAAYVEAIETLHPELMGRVRFRFLFCEVEPPYAVTVADAAGTMRALGEHKWRRACETWARCLETGLWPGYSDDVMQIEAKPWQLSEAAEGSDNGINF